MAPDAGVSVTLSRLVGLRRAMSILLTNPVISAPEALAMGIVTKVVPDVELAEASLAMARELAEGAPKALAATKRLVWAGTGTSIEQCLSEEARTVSELSGMADRGKGSPPSSSGANQSLRDASKCQRPALGLSGGSAAAVPSSRAARKALVRRSCAALPMPAPTS